MNKALLILAFTLTLSSASSSGAIAQGAAASPQSAITPLPDTIVKPPSTTTPPKDTIIPAQSAAPPPGSPEQSASTGAPTPLTGTVQATPNALDLNAQAPPTPTMSTVIQQVPLTVDKQQLQRGPYVGLMLHVRNGTNSPLLFDGNRAQVKLGSQVITPVSDAKLEAVTAPNPTPRDEATIALEDAVTISAVSTIHDEKIERGPILPRYGLDQKRREATLERFGLRILWPGDEVQGILYFSTNEKLDGVQVQLPVVTFPELDIRGYLTAGLH